MDKKRAIKLSRNYLIKVRNSDINFSQAWLFGSFAKGTNDENSDIDLAIVLSKNKNSFETEVKLMTLRSGEEIMIEPHAFGEEEFEISRPIVFQIIKNGEKIKV